ncbi:hypothetical protein TNCV_3188741 [Trichonephila clavipes]|nr:hypothetical protein TNCV_3188741 [Trichonephila clavipes]
MCARYVRNLALPGTDEEREGGKGSGLKRKQTSVNADWLCNAFANSGRVVSEADICSVSFHPREGMDVCKYIEPSWGTEKSHRAAIPIVKLVEGEGMWEALDSPQGVL